MKLYNWIKRKMGLFLLATSKVEKDAFSQKHNFESGQKINNQISQDNLVNDLIKVKITQEVKNLRWRTYKVLQHSRGFKSSIDTETGEVKVRKITHNLKKINLDNDLYPLEILFKNGEDTTTFSEALNKLNISNDNNKVSLDELNSNIKSKSYLSVFRDGPANFNLENYTTKLHIRKYSEDKKLIEFYISKYPNSFDRKSKLLISKIEKLKVTPKFDNILDIKEIGFSSFQTLGCEDFNEFLYKIDKFDSIIEFNGSYIIKFIGQAIFENKYMLTEFIEDELEYKYTNKERKDNNDTIHFDNTNINI